MTAPRPDAARTTTILVATLALMHITVGATVLAGLPTRRDAPEAPDAPERPAS
ncbi:hypothetical protein [Streptomyces sp. SM13]|uniref:hypothetical protein n=1 Tax=Streptomyces sp. SM13 TaxID=1983803 RepID=UPI0015E1729E|nr:hypothetical protein [Streptomyces sp. SM13]